MRALVTCVVVVWFGCNDKKPAETGSGSGSGSGSAVAVVKPDAAVSDVPSTPPPTADDSEETSLPLSSDVLSKGDATPDTRVVSGEGYQFQMPRRFHHGDHPSGKIAYSGNVHGMVDDAKLTFWATSEPFKGKLDDLVSREVAAAKAAGAKEVPEPGPVLMIVGKDVKTGYAQRVTITFGDKIELRTMTVHAGKAYVMHCETPNVANAWANVGSDCIARSTTFTVAPEPFEVKSAEDAAKPPPPTTEGVVFMMSKVTGKARTKQVVNPWLDDAAPYLKPCLAAMPSGTTWTITFELAQDGKAGHSKVVGGPEGEEKPGDADTTACIAKAIEGQSIKGHASGVVTVTAIFVRN